MLTEKEACKKYCPIIKDECVGSKCMSWVDKVYQHGYFPGHKQNKDGEYLGYCRLIGKDEK